MPRPPRIQFAGAFYHIYNRGVDKALIVRDDRDRKTFMKLLAQTVHTFRLRLFAYCLMDNHYHLFFQTIEKNLENAMWHLQSHYAHYLNERHERIGPLFQGRYQSRLVQTDVYALTLARYIHRNPLEAGMVNHLPDYPWSSFASYLGYLPAWKWLDMEWLLLQLDLNQVAALKMFKQIHETPLSESDRKRIEGRGLVLGTSEFKREITDRCQAPVPGT